MRSTDYRTDWWTYPLFANHPRLKDMFHSETSIDTIADRAGVPRHTAWHIWRAANATQYLKIAEALLTTVETSTHIARRFRVGDHTVTVVLAGLHKGLGITSTNRERLLKMEVRHIPIIELLLNPCPPSKEEIARRCQVSRPTVYRVAAALAEEGSGLEEWKERLLLGLYQ